MAIDRKKFYAGLRASKLFGGKLTAGQVNGMECILDAWYKYYPDGGDLRQLAYVLATPYHECTTAKLGRSMQPIAEYGGATKAAADAYFTKQYDITGRRPATAKRYGNVRFGDGIKYRGRGFVQLTWANNYANMGKKLGVDLVGNPDLAMDPIIAGEILVIGMRDGDFTGVSLRTFINAKGCNFVGARKIINGLDSAEKIAIYANQFLDALKAAK